MLKSLIEEVKLWLNSFHWCTYEKKGCVASNAAKSGLSPRVSALGQTANTSAWDSHHLPSEIQPHGAPVGTLALPSHVLLPIISSVWDNESELPGLSAPCASDSLIGRPCGPGTWRTCVAWRGGSAGVTLLFTRALFLLSDATFRSKWHLYGAFPLSRWNRSVSAASSRGMHLVDQTLSLSLFIVLVPESLDSSCLKASKERGPCSVFETGWHRFPRI